MSTLARLRDARIRLSAISCVMTRTESRPIDLSFCARPLVFGESTVSDSTTARRPSRASCDRIAAMPARYIFLLTLWLKFSSGVFGKIRPPPRHNGDEVMPARARAQARVRLEGDDDLVDERLVVVAREHGVGSVDLRGRLALLVDHVELHQAAPFAVFAAAFDGAFTAGRTTTWPFLAPGTAPRTSSSWRASSMRTMSRFCVVRLTLPSWPDIFLPGKTRPGSCAIEIEPGTL